MLFGREYMFTYIGNETSSYTFGCWMNFNTKQINFSRDYRKLLPGIYKNTNPDNTEFVRRKQLLGISRRIL